MSRIELTDTGMDVLIKMADGNPGAISALTEILKNAEDIDPQSGLGPVGPILMLDTYGIYGTEIYVLYNDECGRDIKKLLLLIRGTQMGFLAPEELQAAAMDQSRRTHITDDMWSMLIEKVGEALHEFKLPVVEEVADA